MEVLLRDPATDEGVALWMDAKHSLRAGLHRRRAARGTRAASLAVEPMTAPPNAFNSGDGLVVLAPAGSEGDEHSASWGIRAL